VPDAVGLSFSSVDSFDSVVTVVVYFLLTLAADFERDLDFDFNLEAGTTLFIGRGFSGNGTA
jgi:hypothetical protein